MKSRKSGRLCRLMLSAEPKLWRGFNLLENRMSWILLFLCQRLVLTNFYDIIKVHNLCKDNCITRMLKCKYRKEMTLWKTKI